MFTSICSFQRKIKSKFVGEGFERKRRVLRAFPQPSVRWAEPAAHLWRHWRVPPQSRPSERRDTQLEEREEVLPSPPHAPWQSRRNLRGLLSVDFFPSAGGSERRFSPDSSSPHGSCLFDGFTQALWRLQRLVSVFSFPREAVINLDVSLDFCEI